MDADEEEDVEVPVVTASDVWSRYAAVFHGGTAIVDAKGVATVTAGSVSSATTGGKAGGVMSKGSANGFKFSNPVTSGALSSIGNFSFSAAPSHLADICVSRGQKVQKGKKIGTVGMTGSSFAPHLHYEVIFNGTYCDPVCYLLDGVGMEEYADNVYMSINTEQSMD